MSFYMVDHIASIIAPDLDGILFIVPLTGGAGGGGGGLAGDAETKE
jgi:hypothetical protein